MPSDRINVTLLRRRVEALRDKRSPNSLANGQPKTGAKQVILDNFEEIRALRAAQASWKDIAAGLAEQGVIQGDNEPITNKRVAALFFAVAKQLERGNKNANRRRARPSKTAGPVEQPSKSPSPEPLALPKLDGRPSDTRVAKSPPEDESAASQSASMNEAELRRDNFESYARFFEEK